MKFWFERGAWVRKKTREKFSSVLPEQIKSIAIIRHAALGDMILIRAFIHEARKFFPNARITLSIVSNYAYGVPEDMVDRVHVAIGSDRREATIREQINQARALGPHDIVFDLAMTTRSVWLCLLNKFGMKIGYPYRTSQRWLYDAVIFRSDFEFEAQIMLDMLRLLGAKPALQPDFRIDVKAHQQQGRNIIYFTSASTADKCWPKHHFAELIRKASSSYPDYSHTILNGIASWEDAADLAEQLSDLDNVHFQQAMEINETLSYLKAASLLVCNDTGIRNMAISCETPTVGIFFNTVPYRYWPKYGKHDAVFNENGTVPEVEKVLWAMQGILTQE